ncbi:MAG: hypothetical protein ABIA63_04745, partial [bacterium]
ILAQAPKARAIKPRHDGELNFGSIPGTKTESYKPTEVRLRGNLTEKGYYCIYHEIEERLEVYRPDHSLAGSLELKKGESLSAGEMERREPRLLDEQSAMKRTLSRYAVAREDGILTTGRTGTFGWAGTAYHTKRPATDMRIRTPGDIMPFAEFTGSGSRIILEHEPGSINVNAVPLARVFAGIHPIKSSIKRGKYTLPIPPRFRVYPDNFLARITDGHAGHFTSNGNPSNPSLHGLLPYGRITGNGLRLVNLLEPVPENLEGIAFSRIVEAYQSLHETGTRLRDANESLFTLNELIATLGFIGKNDADALKAVLFRTGRSFIYVLAHEYAMSQAA